MVVASTRRWLLLLVGIFILSKLIQAEEEEADDEEFASCAGRCDESYFPGKPCYCNEACAQYENCCYDYYPECQPDFVWSDEWFEHGGHDYKYFSDTAITAHNARQACRTHGAQLVSINDQEEQSFIQYSVVKQRTLSAFIGSTDEAQEGTWLWADGSRVAMPSDPWNQWYEGEPDDENGNQDCSVFTNYKYWSIRKQILDFYAWRDYNCHTNPVSEIQGFICERTLACSPNPCANNGSCLYVGGPNELECLCATDYVGDRCQYQVRAGEPWTHCGETRLTNETGVISSPLFPKLYPDNVRCQWLIESQGQLAIALTLQVLDLEWGKECDFDHLAIYDGNTENASLLLPDTCGSLNDNTSDRGLALTSSGSEVLVVFHTDHSVQRPGFLLHYEQERCGAGTGDSGCGTRQQFTADCGQITIHQGPTAAGRQRCQWYISVTPGLAIRLDVARFHVQDTGLDCAVGYVAIYDGPDQSRLQMGTYCGKRFPWQLYSSTNQMYIEVVGLEWDSSEYGIELSYGALEPSSYQVLTPVVELRGRQGHFSSATSIVHARALGTDVYKWLVAVPIGDLLEITWSVQASEDATLRIYDGVSEESGLVASVDISSGQPDTRQGVSSANSFQMLVVFTRRRSDSGATFEASYRAVDWLPGESGCYRPHFYHNISSRGTENNVITDLEPVTIMVSDKSYSTVDPGYDAGTYCKWLLKGSAGSQLVLEVMDARLEPLETLCGYDGVAFYDGDRTTATRHGPFCGSTDLEDKLIMASSNEMLVVFYSDSRGGRRPNGIFRASVRTAVTDTNMCPIHYMKDDIYTNTLEEAACGVIMSPHFPGVVQPGLWAWLLQAPEGMHFIFYVYYVRGPGIISEVISCNEYFAVVEIPHDAQTLRQYEANLLKLCEDTKVFVPSKRIKSPLLTKVMIELNTLSNTIVRQWEFKLAYTVAPMAEPKHFIETQLEDRSLCPENYQYYSGHCYRYYPWLLRHYLPEEYQFQQSWQKALVQCESENATHVSIHSEDEAYFLKYIMNHEWFWDPAATYQNNHRLIYIGLHNRYGHYEWTDTSQLGYADWYRPPPSWAQPAVAEDTRVMDILNLESPQPNADVGSLCTVMMVTSPHSSLNWAKVPCDYPIFRTGVICEKSAFKNSQDEEDVHSPVNELNRIRLSETNITVCPAEWLMVNGRCLLVYAFYQLNDTVGANDTMPAHVWGNVTYDVAEETCTNQGAAVALLTQDDSGRLADYLQLWHYGPERGNIWLQSQFHLDSCQYVQVRTEHRLDETVQYETVQSTCSSLPVMGAVVCQTTSTVLEESCGHHEFQCRNKVCLLLDYVCDGCNDCWDGSDEEDCGCHEGTFQCKNGRCISVSMRCDFKDQCGDHSDEEGCVLEKCAANTFRCQNGECLPGEKQCDFHKDCLDGSDEFDELCETKCDGFMCYSGRCLPKSLRQDAVSDCPGLSFEDETEGDQKLTIFDVYQDEFEQTKVVYEGCVEGGTHAQCQALQKKCYPRNLTCIYDTMVVDEGSNYQVQTSCRDGAHLRTNCATVDCPGMFHCPGSYCIPYRKMCDGVKDCPQGHDELECENYVCAGLHRCKGSSYCIPHSEMCDGITHCAVERDDEKYCGTIDILCAQCDCHSHVAFCEDRNLVLLPEPEIDGLARPLRAIQLAHNHVLLSSESFLKLHWLTKLNISYNSLTQLPTGLFRDLSNLLELDISRNMLSYLQPGVFDGLLSLKMLDLGGNMLGGLQRAALPYMSPLEHLILTENMLGNLDKGTFDDLQQLTTLDTDAFKFCCIAKHVSTCTPEADEFSSCEDLMANYALQVSIWVLGFSAFIGNLFVIAWRVIKERNNMKVSAFFIINLGCSDFLMGIYMLIIASVDIHYRGEYIVHADSWRSSRLCQFAGVLAMVSSEVSVFMLTAITVDRAMAILFPLKMGRVQLSHAVIAAACGWIFALFMSILPTTGLSYFGDAYFGTTGVCLPFVVSSQRLPGWEYSVFIFLVINSVSFLVIFAAYILIFSTVKSSMREMGATSTNSIDEYALAKKLVIIVATDFLCWVPIILIGFAALGGATIAPEVSAWIAVFILPLNSSLNPILYTISAIECGGKRKKRPASSMSTSMGAGGRPTKMSVISESSVGQQDGGKEATVTA